MSLKSDERMAKTDYVYFSFFKLIISNNVTKQTLMDKRLTEIEKSQTALETKGHACPMRGKYFCLIL